MASPRIIWDIGTAYDLFVSLYVLHNPSNFGLRAAWAAGMRSRLPAADREFLEDIAASDLNAPPLAWIYALPGTKDSLTALETLDAIPAPDRLAALMPIDKWQPATIQMLHDVSRRRAWGEDEHAMLRAEFVERFGMTNVTDRKIAGMLGWWARSEDYGTRLLNALHAYYEVFFAEEERRIRPVLEAELSRARELASRLDYPALIEALSQGVRVHGSELPAVVLAPTYWGAPYLFLGQASPEMEIMLFGARPQDSSLVPGETVPDALINALKALSDPTRLRILRYLTAEALTPTQLARRLRLRAPTVIHHLQALRTAGLVYVLISESKEKAYQSRVEGVMSVCDMLNEFLRSPDGTHRA